MQDRDLIQQLDALRPASDDLGRLADDSVRARLDADPESRDLYERIQSMDAVLGAAIREVEPPAGLEERLLARLRAVDGTAAADNVNTVQPAARAAGGAKLRRWSLAAAAGLAVAASIAAVLVWQIWPQKYVIQDVDGLLARAMEFYVEDTGSQAERLQDPQIARAYPISDSVQAGATPRFRRVPDFLGRTAVAYELTGPGRSQATLYVWREHLPMLPASPRARRPLATGGLWASAWQESGVAYVLVVRGDAAERNAEEFFLKPFTPTA